MRAPLHSPFSSFFYPLAHPAHSYSHIRNTLLVFYVVHAFQFCRANEMDIKTSCSFGQLIISLNHMSEAKLRTVVFYDHYFSEFYLKQRQRVKDKIVWTLRIIETQRHIPTDYLKHIEGTNGLYEIRVQHRGDVFRIFCFFDEGRLVVLANGFQKKTRKTPAEEIQRAIRIKRDYEQEKERENT